MGNDQDSALNDIDLVNPDFLMFTSGVIDSATEYTFEIKFGPSFQGDRISLNWPEVIVKALAHHLSEFLGECIGVLSPAPLAFLEVKFEVGLDAVELRQPALGEGPEALDAVDMHAVLGEMPGFVDAQMAVVADVHQPVVAAPSVAHQHRVKRHLASDNLP